MWQGTAAEGFGSTSTWLFFFFLSPTLGLFSWVAPPTFNPFRDVTMDLPLSNPGPCMGLGGGRGGGRVIARRLPTNLGAGDFK